MTTNFPTSQDNWSNPTSETTLADSGYEHDIAHTRWIDSVEAIENEWLNLIGHPWPSDITGSFFIPQGGTATNSPASGYFSATPFVLPRPITVTQVMIQCTVGAADSQQRLGFYAPGGSDIASWGDHSPGALISEIGTFSGTTAAYVTVTGLSINLPTGISWLASLAEGTGVATWSVSIHNSRFPIDQYIRCTPNAAGSSTTLRYLGIQRDGQTTGSLPDPFGGTAISSRYTASARIMVE